MLMSEMSRKIRASLTENEKSVAVNFANVKDTAVAKI